MTKKIKRRLTIGEEVYYWIADKKKMDLYPFSEMHIRVHQDNKTKSILYIDATSWYFEISPSSIKGAIAFALSNKWDPKKAGETIYISVDENGFFVLPNGVKHAFEMN